MTNMGGSMQNSFEKLRGMVADSFQIAPRPASLDIQAQALKAIQKDEDLDVNTMASAVIVIGKDSSFANIYLNMENKPARTLYLLRSIGELEK
jgi:hypothetical protein